MDRLHIKAEVRETGRKGVTNRLRREGKIPVILYGLGEKAIPLAVPAKEFTTKVREAGLNTLIDLEIVDRPPLKSPLVVMLKDFQTDTLTHAMTHIDLLKINLKEKVTIKVPLQIVGKAVGLIKGGLVEQPRRELEVECLPGNIPEVIEIDITPLDMGDNLHGRDVKLPEGVALVGDADFTVVSIVAPREEEVAPPPATAEAAPEAGAAAGEAAPAAAAAGAAEAKGDKTEKGEKK